MKDYIVRFNPDAVRDMETSFEWGVRNWGEAEAQKWLRELQLIVRKRLREFPMSCPIAPESADFGFQICHLVYERYRILYTVKGILVLVLHLRGPFID